MGRTPIEKAAIVFGGIFLVIGLGGFIPGLTTDYDEVYDIGGVGGREFGFLGVNVVENVVHLLYGVGGFLLARTPSSARAYFLGGGAVYLVVWIYGLVIDLSSNANLIGVNAAANWVHFVLGVVMIGVGLTLGRPAVRPASA